MMQRLKVDGLFDHRRACDCSFYIVFFKCFFVGFIVFPWITNLCCTIFVFDSYDDAHGDGRGFDGQELVR